MIPKKIHFCWYGKGAYNDVLKKCILSWKEKLPDYEIKKWDESNTPFDKFPFLKLLYKQKKWSFISDYIRLYSIYTEGGIYLDADIEVLKKFDDLLENKVFIGFQTDLTNMKSPINSAVVGAVKGNAFILDSLKETEKKQRLQFNAMGGPPIVSKVLFSYGLNIYKLQEINGVKVYPTEYFYPLPWKVNFEEAPNYVTKNSYCIHWWQESWTTKKHDYKYYLDSLLRKIEKLPLLINSRLKYTFNNKSFYHVCNINDNSSNG
jgi:mannosyltransferase OCH1-like enzyme